MTPEDPAPARSRGGDWWEARRDGRATGKAQRYVLCACSDGVTRAGSSAWGDVPCENEGTPQSLASQGFAGLDLFYSHSTVAGGLLVMSYTTRLTPGTSLTMRVEMRSSTS